MQVGQEKDKGGNVILLTTDQAVSEAALTELTSLPSVTKALSLEL